MKKRTLLVAVVVLVVGSGLLVVTRKQREIARLPRPVQGLPMVQTAPVTSGTLEVTAHYLGKLTAFTQADLSTRISGSILSVDRREGDRVSAGEVLALIDDRELVARTTAADAEVLATRQRLIGAQSAFATQTSVYARDEKLFAAGAVSRESLERSQTALAAAKATMDAFEESIKGLTMIAEAARTQAGYARIVAPFDGVVTARWMEPGDLAVPGRPILTIEKTAPFKITAQLPQEELRAVKPGGPVHVTSGDSTLATTISRVYPALGSTLLGAVEIVMPTPPFGLPSGSAVGVDLVTAAPTGRIVPENALIRTAAGSYVLVIENGIVHQRAVAVLGVAGGKAVLSGELAAGQQVAVGQENRLLRLADGSAVTAAGGKE